ncbi:insulinase family protein [Desulfovibrio cuneatus]|uniref:insulinase family protein n=1 Tax=Desulfovibrio cuneatus TaxID=159728 RepID=UPI0003FB3324|nr:insulinase family protein [Desulfovibrio cuneatus]
MTIVHGFSLVEETHIAELDSTARLWRHEKTQAVLLSFTNTDENKVFGVSFRTPPPDSTGVAHILEHSVLCGSEKYPVKEPFVELLKGSLQTFLNAFTYPDKTCYPVASCNLRDFRNLTDVYLDAVFFPRITEEIFQQEGWHLEADSADAPLTYKGVVYNEMKGVFSSPESVLGRYSLHALFPDTVYGLESGGDPKVIPALTYADFVGFHQQYYHPTNGRFFFWGDDNETERLELLNKVLQRFDARPVDSSIGIQPFFTAPREVQVPFAAGEGEKAMATLNWLLPETAETELNLGLRMLEHILLGMPASPLRRALMESGLGEDLAGQGLETELRQMTFDIGLKGMAEENIPHMQALILETLQTLVKQGISPEAVDAAVNSIEFSLRENNTGKFPVGLSVMLRSLTTWLHEGNPFAPLRFEGPLAAIKGRIASGERYFEGLVQRWLLENTHRITVALLPQPELAQVQEQEEKAALAAIAAGMSRAERQAVVENAAALQRMQGEPDKAEDLATIPRLLVGDLPRTNAHIESKQVAPAPVVFFQPQPTAGIAYVEVCFSLDAVPDQLLPLVPLFGRALVEMGTQNRSFTTLNMDIARFTGGIDSDLLFLTRADSGAALGMMGISGKAAPDKLEALFELLRDVLAAPSFDQKDRFLSMVLEEKARQEHGLVPAGHTVVAARLRASLAPAAWLSEQASGLEALYALRTLATQVENDWPAVLENLHTLARCIITQSGMQVNLTALPEQEQPLGRLTSALAAALPTTSPPKALRSVANIPAREALVLPAQVNYVGKGVNLFTTGYAWHGSAAVILKYLRTGYLWEKVRVQGGAYGCMCGLDRTSGAFFIVSYRDPNVLPTVQVYDGVAAHLAEGNVGKAELDAAIVGAIGELDSHLLPDAKGSAAFVRRLCGDTEARRQQLREDILGTTAADVRRFGEALAAFTQQGRICALGGNAVAQAAAEQGWTSVTIL